MKAAVEYALMKTYMFSKYVDDVNLVLVALGLGVRWDPQKRDMVWKEQWEIEDKANQHLVSDQKRTANQILRMVRHKELHKDAGQKYVGGDETGGAYGR